MELSALQIVGIIFALFAWSRALLRLRDRKISLVEFLFWSVIWAGVLVALVLPRTAEIISYSVGVERPIDLAVFASILLMFYLMFRLYVKHEQHEQEFTKLVRTITLERPRRK
jgi:hypothetical protein